MADFERIETPAALADLAQQLLRQKVLAIDTEADSFYHYFDKTCLVQIATRKRVYLVDPLAMGGPKALAALGPVFAARDVRKIFHAAAYDLFILKRDCGFDVVNLFDTMVSAQLLGYSAVGLGALVEHHTGIKLPKDEQRSDWSLRPLRASQMKYAAADVEHLIAIAEKLERELKKKRRLDWAHEEFTTLLARERSAPRFDKLGYLRIKGARTLDPVSLSVLRELHWVRDARAREIDRPAFKVLGNRALLGIAELRPKGLRKLGEVKGVSDLIVRRIGAEILEAVARGEQKEHGPLPRRISGTGSRRRMDRASERRLTQLKKWRSTRAQELALDPGVLCPNVALEAIASAKPKDAGQLGALPELKQWFLREFGGEIFEVAAAG